VLENWLGGRGRSTEFVQGEQYGVFTGPAAVEGVRTRAAGTGLSNCTVVHFAVAMVHATADLPVTAKSKGDLIPPGSDLPHDFVESCFVHRGENRCCRAHTIAP